MPFTETEAVEQRRLMIEDWLSGRFKKTELARSYGVSRPTVDKWIERFRQHGLSGLEDQPRRPKSCPHKTAPEVEAMVVAMRKRFPRWGPKKLKPLLERAHPGVDVPAVSTIGDILKRHGLVEPRKRRRKSAKLRKPRWTARAPNEVWCADFKGEFKTRDGKYCYPLTMTDGYSRYLIECRAMVSTELEPAKEIFAQAFERYGLPRRMRTDNGLPFASPGGLCGLSRLSVWWLKLGILPERIEPGRPDQNGRHERMHRTLKAATTRPPEADLDTQQRSFDDFQQVYNEIRPHEALNQQPPDEHYQPSPRPFEEPDDFAYPAHWEVRLAASNGHIKFKGHDFFMSYTLAGERLGLVEIDDGRWSVLVGPMLLGRFDERAEAFTPLQAPTPATYEEDELDWV